MASDLPSGVNLTLFESEEVNISRWWAHGIEYINENFDSEHILIMNSDVVVMEAQIRRLAVALDDSGAVMASFDQHSVLPNRGWFFNNDTFSPMDYRWRIFGSCFMIRNTDLIYPDADFRWWYADDDLEFQARQSGGTVLVGGDKVQHPELGGTLLSGQLLDWSLEDRERFKTKWQTYPH